MRKMILIDMFSIYNQVYSIDDTISNIVNKCLHKINDIIPSSDSFEEVYFIFESKQYQKESYENKKEVKANRKNYESYEMGKNYLIEILKVENENFRIIKIPKHDHEFTFSTLCKQFKDDKVEIYSQNMLLCKNLTLNVVYNDGKECITLDSFISSFGFIPNKYSITFYFFLKSYIESEIMERIIKDCSKTDWFNSFSNYVKVFDFETQNKIKKTIRQIKDIFEFYDYKKDTELDLDYLVHKCQKNSIKKELLLNSIGLQYKKSNDPEKFFNV